MKRSPALLFFAVAAMALPAPAQQNDSTIETFERVAGDLSDHRYELRYKFEPEESIAYEVEHLVKVKTTIDGVSDTQQSRSTSRKIWEVAASNENGSVFTHSIDYLNMWSESQGRAPVKYDSREADEPPPEYEQVAKIVGKPLTVVKVDTVGNILDRQDKVKQFEMGTGGLMMPLPNQSVRVGDTWAVPRDVPVRQEDGSFKSIKTRQRYRLEKVESGVAIISMKTQILTPSITPRIRSQLIQKLSNGEIRFDIDNGRVLSRKLEWDETVVGFNGPKSNMEYLGRITEEYVPADRMARK